MDQRQTLPKKENNQGLKVAHNTEAILLDDKQKSGP